MDPEFSSNAINSGSSSLSAASFSFSCFSGLATDLALQSDPPKSCPLSEFCALELFNDGHSYLGDSFKFPLGSRCSRGRRSYFYAFEKCNGVFSRKTSIR